MEGRAGVGPRRAWGWGFGSMAPSPRAEGWCGAGGCCGWPGNFSDLGRKGRWGSLPNCEGVSAGGAKLRANGGFGSGEGGICRGGAGQMPSEVGGEVARGWAVGGGKGLAGDGRRVGGALVRGLRPTL